MLGEKGARDLAAKEEGCFHVDPEDCLKKVGEVETLLASAQGKITGQRRGKG